MIHGPEMRAVRSQGRHSGYELAKDTWGYIAHIPN